MKRLGSRYARTDEPPETPAEIAQFERMVGRVIADLERQRARLEERMLRAEREALDLDEQMAALAKAVEWYETRRAQSQQEIVP